MHAVFSLSLKYDFKMLYSSIQAYLSKQLGFQSKSLMGKIKWAQTLSSFKYIWTNYKNHKELISTHSQFSMDVFLNCLENLRIGTIFVPRPSFPFWWLHSELNKNNRHSSWLMLGIIIFMFNSQCTSQQTCK